MNYCPDFFSTDEALLGLIEIEEGHIFNKYLGR